ncbi:MAG: peptide deformylase [Spirochaetales bacterium]|nr:peptide deformylase [Spirochaetales bacterium]
MRSITYYGEPVLREIATKVEDINEEIVALIEEMAVSMEENNGIGLAAPQVGVSKTLFITHAPNDKLRVFINPEILSTSPETCLYEEGCLSVPGVYGKVKRSEKISIQAYDQRGKVFKLDADGMLARVIQHEYDHLKGKLFIDYLPEKKVAKIIKKLQNQK